MNRQGWEIFEGGIDDIIIVPYSADGRVGMTSSDDGIGEGLGEGGAYDKKQYYRKKVFHFFILIRLPVFDFANGTKH